MFIGPTFEVNEIGPFSLIIFTSSDESIVIKLPVTIFTFWISFPFTSSAALVMVTGYELIRLMLVSLAKSTDGPKAK